jgi:hypothetical protein
MRNICFPPYIYQTSYPLRAKKVEFKYSAPGIFKIRRNNDLFITSYNLKIYQVETKIFKLHRISN